MSGALVLRPIPGRFAVCRLPASSPLPPWALAAGGGLRSVTRIAGELSIVAPEQEVPAGVCAERGWRALAVDGPLDFGLVGVLARLTAALAQAAVPVFVLSTHDTDLLLVGADRYDDAVAALNGAVGVEVR